MDLKWIHAKCRILHLGLLFLIHVSEISVSCLTGSFKTTQDLFCMSYKLRLVKKLLINRQKHPL